VLHEIETLKMRVNIDPWHVLIYNLGRKRALDCLVACKQSDRRSMPPFLHLPSRIRLAKLLKLAHNTRSLLRNLSNSRTTFAVLVRNLSKPIAA
jgi:hypothetical protein